jgi:hypothetical protein
LNTLARLFESGVFGIFRGELPNLGTLTAIPNEPESVID